MVRLLLSIFAITALSVAEPEKPAPLRYLRPAGDKLVLESEITVASTAEGRTYVSRTERGAEKMTLTLRSDKNGQLLSAEALQETAKDRKSAVLTIQGDKAHLKRGETTDSFPAPVNPIVTTAPDWTDIFELIRRYDGAKGGKQEFAGLWIHPVQPTLMLTFTVERVGKDAVKVKDQALTLDRYRIRLRSGDYLVWADESRRVCKLIPASKPAALVVLEGFEEATRSLGQPRTGIALTCPTRNTMVGGLPASQPALASIGPARLLPGTLFPWDRTATTCGPTGHPARPPRSVSRPRLARCFYPARRCAIVGCNWRPASSA